MYLSFINIYIDSTTKSNDLIPQTLSDANNVGELFCDWIRASSELVTAGDGSIVECYWEKYSESMKQACAPRVGEWRYMRKRTDKPKPNADWVVKKIMDSLDSDILESELREISQNSQ